MMTWVVKTVVVKVGSSTRDYHSISAENYAM